ncbi:MAG: hypothetical protein IR164_15710 [Devosia sp.]|uniref:hypothetical protein n=1 Tax=Devosia sp. TaxID=1871048 RepID=UPI0019FBF488|nr:hypothetical protein [Devosia sp.]MBF0680373.1 hypothetical protein [Devosia sp.]
MRILAFPGRFNARTKAPVRDWSTQEIADFYRAHRLLAENGAGIGIDRGVSDEGEPWMVFFDTVSQDVFLHIARIDDVCYLVCESFDMRLEAADITALIAQFEHAVRDQLAIRSDRAKNVVVHPAARIIMSISVVFLLFKLENGEAHAKGLSDKTAALGADARATEKSVSALARAQSAFARAFDAVDAPVNAALLAGLILAGELVLKPLHANHDAEIEKLVALALAADHEPVLVNAEGAAIEAAVADAIHHVPQPVAVDVPEVVALNIPVAELPDAPMLVQFTPAENVVKLVNPGPVADFRVAQIVPLAVEAPAKEVSDTLVVSQAEIDAAKMLELLFSGIKLAPGQLVESDLKKPIRIGEISIDNFEGLKDLRGEFGFAQDLQLDFAPLYKLVNYFKEQMDGYSFQYRTDGRILIEQKGLGGMDVADLGLITNSTPSGGSYTIVGRVDIIDDVLDFFA